MIPTRGSILSLTIEAHLRAPSSVPGGVMTPTPDQPECEQPEVDPHFQIDWQQRLRDQLADAARRRQAEADLRRQLAQRRDAGLRARHAQKLGRHNGHQVSDDLGPTTSQVETASATGSDQEPDIHIPGPTAPPAEMFVTRTLVGPTWAQRADNPANAAGGHPQTGADQREHERAPATVAELRQSQPELPGETVSDETPTEVASTNEAAALDRLRRANRGGYQPRQEQP